MRDEPDEPRVVSDALDLLSRHEQLRREVSLFHAEHPEVWEMFERFTMQLIAAGRDHFGAKAVWERMRWETAVNPAYGEDYKLNNNYHAFYARRFARVHPKHADFFRFRKQKSADECAR